MHKRRRNLDSFNIKYTLSMSVKSFSMNLNFPKIILCFNKICIYRPRKRGLCLQIFAVVIVFIPLVPFPILIVVTAQVGGV